MQSEQESASQSSGTAIGRPHKRRQTSIQCSASHKGNKLTMQIRAFMLQARRARASSMCQELPTAGPWVEAATNVGTRFASPEKRGVSCRVYSHRVLTQVLVSC